MIAPCERAQHAATMAGARAALGGEVFATAWQQGLLAQIDDLQADLAPPGTAAGPRPADHRPPGRIRPPHARRTGSPRQLRGSRIQEPLPRPGAYSASGRWARRPSTAGMSP